MLCRRCGEETPEGSAYCENCGCSLENQVAPETADDSIPPASADALPTQSDSLTQESPLEWGAPFDPLEVIEPEDSFVEVRPSDYVYNEWDKDRYEGTVPPMRAEEMPFEDGPLVELPTPPGEFKLEKQRIAVVAVVSVLFAAVLVMLACAVVLRLIGF